MSTVDTRRGMIGTGAVVAVVVLPPFLLGALAPRIDQDMTFGATQLGLALAACYAVTGALSPLAGRVVRRLGGDAALRIASMMAAVGLLGVAGATRPAHLLPWLILIGAANALTQPASNDLLSEVQDPRLRAQSFGLVQAAIPAAALVAGAILAVVSYHAPWRAAVVAVAVAAAAAQLLLPRRPRAVPGPARMSDRVLRPDPAGRPLLVALVISGCLASAAATALPAFAASTGVAIGVSPWLVAVAQVTGSLTSIVVRVAAPVATSGATLGHHLLTVAVLQSVGLLGMLAMATGTPAGFAVGCVAAFGFGWGWNGLFNLIVAISHPGQVAATTGLTQAGVFFGGAVGPLCFATVAQDDRLGAAWVAMAVIMAAAVAAAGDAARRAPNTVRHTHVARYSR